MNNNKRNTIKDLLLKFHADTISMKDFNNLNNIVNNSSDEELSEIFREHWDTYEDNSPLSDEKMHLILTQVKQKRRKMYTIKHLQHYWVQIAASLLLIVSISLSIALSTMSYNRKQDMQQLAEQNVVINSGESGSSQVTLPDGTKVLLNKHSSLTYKQNFGRKDRKVRLTGEGYFEVTKDTTRRFIVGTDFIDITVLGTTFNVYAYESKDFLEMSLVEGRVHVSTNHPPYKTIDVKPNEKVTYNKNTGEILLESTSNKMETAWISEKLVFRHDKLQDVLKALERKYGVTFIVNESRLLQDEYTGVFNEVHIENVLRVLRMHYQFEYSIKENVITIVLKD